MLGDWLTAAANFFAGVWLEAAGPAQVETTVLDWFRQWLGMPDTTRGVLTSGGSEANLTALVVARERVPFADRGRMVLYVADQRHWSVDRAAKVMGLHPSQVRPVPVDDDFRLRGADLARLVRRDRDDGSAALGRRRQRRGDQHRRGRPPARRLPPSAGPSGCGCTSMPPTAGPRR